MGNTEIRTDTTEKVLREAGYPVPAALTGSTKQVAWATEIRAQALGLLDAFIASAEKQTGKTLHEIPDLLRLVQRAEGVADSRWWINSRHELYTVGTVIERFARLTALGK